MLSSVTKHLHGIFSSTVVILITVGFAIPLYILAIIKFLIRLSAFQRMSTQISGWLVARWIGCITFLIRLTLKTEWDIRGVEGLRRDQWYIINSNHQFWTDLPALFVAFHNHVSSFKIFLKKELLWVPIVGTACWAMDFPFVKRYSQAYLKQHPEKRGEDLKVTRKACERYKDTPVSILNFTEGTRFRPEKHRRQNSPYRHLLRPKAGGFAYTLHAMDGRIKTLLDVTIVYPKEPAGLWQFLCGAVSQVIVRVEKSRIPEEYLTGDYLNDSGFRKCFQNWVNECWQRKDGLIEQIRSQASLSNKMASQYRGGKTMNFTALIIKRRSIRRFKNREIEPEKIDLLVEAALRAPTSRGLDPWEFIVIREKTLLEKISTAKPHGASFLKNAALGIVVCANADKSDVWVEDASIASIFIHLAATSLDLGSCWIQIRKRMHDENKSAEAHIAEVLQIPPNLKVESIVAIGYPDEEKPPHSRAELQYQKVHWNLYGKTYEN